MVPASVWDNYGVWKKFLSACYVQRISTSGAHLQYLIGKSVLLERGGETVGVFDLEQWVMLKTEIYRGQLVK